MKRFTVIGLLLAMAVAIATPGFAADPFYNSGFRTGHVTESGTDLYGLFPAGGGLVEVTSVTSTTVFYVETVKGLQSSSTATLNQIDSLFPGKYKLRGVSCFTTANEGFEVTISAFVMGSGKFTTSAWGTALTKGDILSLVPITSGTGDAMSSTVYIRVDTGDYSAANAWDDSGFNKILTVTGLCRIRIIPEIVTGVTGGGATMSLGSASNSQSLIQNTVLGNLDTGCIWATTGQSLVEWPYLYVADQIVNGVNIGHTVATSELTAGRIIYHCYVTPLTPGAGAVAGDGASS